MANLTSLLVDYHCHLDLYPDYEQVFSECTDDGIATLAVTTTPRAWPKNKELGEKSPTVRVALGLHPQLVTERHSEIVLFEKYLGETRFIGEVGLDAAPRFHSTLELQIRTFERILRLCAEAGGRIISIHSVRAMKETLTLIEYCLGADRGRPVLHWFSGTKSDLERAINLGCYFSVNLHMLTSKMRRDIVAKLPLERILTETDGPFTMISNHPSRPKDVAITVANLAHLLGRDVEQIRSQIVANIETLEG
jgi:TatD DNase family protein